MSIQLGTIAPDFTQNSSEGKLHFYEYIEGKWCVFGCMLSAGGSLQWLRNTLFQAEMKKAKDPGDVYPAMIAAASESWSSVMNSAARAAASDSRIRRTVCRSCRCSGACRATMNPIGARSRFESSEVT